MKRAAAVHLSLREDPPPTRELRAALDELGARYGLSDGELFELKVAATEALTNALKGSTRGQPVDVAVEPVEGGIVVEVQNRGTFELADASEVALESEGGRGIPLMLALVDDVEFASTGDGTRVRMRKRAARRRAYSSR